MKLTIHSTTKLRTEAGNFQIHLILADDGVPSEGLQLVLPNGKKRTVWGFPLDQPPASGRPVDPEDLEDEISPTEAIRDQLVMDIMAGRLDLGTWGAAPSTPPTEDKHEEGGE